MILEPEHAQVLRLCRRPVPVGVSGPQLKVHPASGQLAAGQEPKITLPVSHAPHASR